MQDDGKFTPSRLGRLADLVYEAGMLRSTPRSGWAFLGTGNENVASHSYRTSVLGYILSALAGADASRVVVLCLFHDLHEARTGDFNYVNHRYNAREAMRALKDATAGTGLERDIPGCLEEMEANETLEAQVANDADQLDLIANLNVELRKGNEFAREWLDSALKRLRTGAGRQLAEAILRTDPNHWWYGQEEKDWWIHHCPPPGTAKEEKG